jgi:hypothetical protein
MQLSRRFVVLALAAALVGCKDTTAPAPATGQIVAKWAGVVWIGSTSVNVYNYGPAGDTLFISANRTGIPQLEETILVRVRFTGIGTYTLGPGAAQLEELVGGDVLVGQYATTSGATGTLVITRFDPVGKQVEGVLSFDGVSTMQNGRYGTRATLEDGRFSTTFLNLAAP